MTAPTRRTVLAGGAAAIVVGTAPAIADEHPDAELLALGRELDVAWAIETEAAGIAATMSDAEADGYIDPFVIACGEIADCIEDTPATTLEGLMVKARAVGWCRSAEAGLDFAGTQDMAITSQILETLIAMETGA